MSLINDIRSAQVAAAEDAIAKNLESMGLVTPERQREIAIIELARQDTRLDDELEIDSDPKVSEGDDNGAWVAAWIWVDFSETPLDKDEITEEYVGHLSPEELAKDRELVAAALKAEAEVKRLRDLGWKQQDFAQALKNILEETHERPSGEP